MCPVVPAVSQDKNTVRGHASRKLESSEPQTLGVLEGKAQGMGNTHFVSQLCLNLGQPLEPQMHRADLAKAGRAK